MALASVEFTTDAEASRETLAIVYESKCREAKAAHAAFMADRSMGNQMRLDNALREKALALNALRYA